MNPERSHSNFPKLHAAVGFSRKANGAPPIDLSTFLDLATQAEHDGARFDGIDLALHESYLPLTAADSQIKEFASEVRRRGLVVGTIGMPSARRSPESPSWLETLRDTCRIGRRLRSLGARPYGVIQIEAASDPAVWNEDPFGAQRRMVDEFRAACAVADEFGERLAVGSAFLDGHLQDWRSMLDLLERVNRTEILGFHADLAETFRELQKPSSGGRALLPADWDPGDSRMLDAAMKVLAGFLRRWTINLNVAQSEGPPANAPVLPSDPNGRLKLTHHAGMWLHGEGGSLTRGLQHLCWDAGPFPAAVLRKQETWDNALVMMLAIREAHGWKAANARKRVDPAALIVLARKKLRGRNSGTQLSPPARRQTTLKVGRSKARPVAKKENSRAPKARRKQRGKP